MHGPLTLPVAPRYNEVIRPLLQPLASMLEGLGDMILDVGGPEAVDYGRFEELVAEQAGKLEQMVHASALSRLDIDSEFVKVWGSVYKRVGRHEAEYRCMSGPVRVKRSIFRKVGDRNGATVDPVSLRAGVVGDGWLPRTARAMGHLLGSPWKTDIIVR